MLATSPPLLGHMSGSRDYRALLFQARAGLAGPNLEKRAGSSGSGSSGSYRHSQLLCSVPPACDGFGNERASYGTAEGVALLSMWPRLHLPAALLTDAPLSSSLEEASEIQLFLSPTWFLPPIYSWHLSLFCDPNSQLRPAWFVLFYCKRFCM